MRFTVECPKCRKNLSVPEEFLEKTVKCLHCDGTMKLPSMQQLAPSPPPVVPARPVAPHYASGPIQEHVAKNAIDRSPEPTAAVSSSISDDSPAASGQDASNGGLDLTISLSR